MFRNKIFRYVLLALGLLAIIALTGMNVYSLYDVRDKMVEGEEKRQLAVLDEMVNSIRLDIYRPFWPLRAMELEPIERSIENSGQFPVNLRNEIDSISHNPIFNGIYYTPEEVDPCIEGSEVYSYNSATKSLSQTSNYPATVCDGVRLAKTKAKIELNSFDYRWRTTVDFDAHRTMNIGLINLDEYRIIGYLTATLDREYIIDDLIAPKLSEYFDTSKTPGTVVWLHDWANNEVLATNNSDINYDRELISSRQNFEWGNMLENWNIKIAFLDNPIAPMYNATLFKNLFVLGVAVLFLVGALLFMFYTAQKERTLAQRQAGFLANVTHELKTPLAVMQAAGENISDGRVTEPERLKQYGDHIYNESIRLKKMIEKLLDVAKSDSGQTLIKASTQDLNVLVTNFVRDNREYIEAKGFTVKVRTSDDKSIIMVDPDNIETILSNLTENAMKYSTDNKNISYVVQASHKYMALHVSDTGVGIARKHLKNIFKKFYRVEDSLNAKTKGHGLGLSIVQSLAEMNGATVDVKSEVGKGTTFTLRFPIFVKEEKSLKTDRSSTTKPSSITEPTEYAE